MFKVMGWNEDRVMVLDGGLPKFSADYPDFIDTCPAKIPEIIEYDESEFTFRTQMLRNINHIEANLESQNEIVVDARPSGRFNGTAPEPRPGLPSGHMPNSVSIPFYEVLGDEKCVKPKEEIIKIYADLGLDITSPGTSIISSCGSGISAAVLDLALTASGKIIS